jgi:phosphatidate cytidylyltransferase
MYAAIVLVVLAVAGAALAALQQFTRLEITPISRTYRGWLVMVVIIAVFVFLGRASVIVGVTLLSIYGFKEFARACGLYSDWWMTGATYLTIIAVGLVSLLPDPYVPNAFGWFGLFMALPVFCVNFLLMVPILRNQAKGQLQLVALSILGFLYMGWMFGHVGYLVDSDNPYGYLLFIILATELNDVAAFTFGKLLGHRQLRANISPRKTWGGAIGAVCFSLIVPWLLRFSLPGFSARELILTGLIVGIGGQLGDLCISFIKRDIGVKDMGGAIPGHGGILDRIDSLIFVAPLFLHMVDYFNGLR